MKRKKKKAGGKHYSASKNKWFLFELQVWLVISTLLYLLIGKVIKYCGTVKYHRRLNFFKHSCTSPFLWDLCSLRRIAAWPIRMRVWAEERLKSKTLRLFVLLMAPVSLSISFSNYFHFIYDNHFLRFFFFFYLVFPPRKTGCLCNSDACASSKETCIFPGFHPALLNKHHP